MVQRFRLPEGGLIDRSESLGFRFNDTPYRGYAGDTLASALLAGIPGSAWVSGRAPRSYRDLVLFEKSNPCSQQRCLARAGQQTESGASPLAVDRRDGSQRGQATH